MPLLSLRDVSVDFHTPEGVVHAVDRVSLDVRPGEVLGVVGESGCGKTVTALSVLGLVPSPPGRVHGGQILFQGRDLLTASKPELRKVRGAEISMIFQDPQSSLNPVLSIGQQISGVLRAHDRRLSTAAARSRAVELLTKVGVPDAATRIGEYPHQWSGGMCQRAMIAMAIANHPKLLIADEPTTALDVTIQAQVLDVLREAQRETGAGIILITHDLGVVAEMADRVAVMYAGRVVETGPVEDIFWVPRHPYTAGLMRSLPRLDGDVRPLEPIPGQPPSLIRRPSGCAFQPRCGLGGARDRCSTEAPELARASGDGHWSACHFQDETPVRIRLGPSTGSTSARSVARTARGADGPAPPTRDDEVLRVEDLVVRFPVRSGPLRRVSGHVRAVDGISFSLAAGETLGLVGESGCGKSTTALAVMRLVAPTSGRILFRGTNLAGYTRRQLRDVRREIQIVHQDPRGSFNPRMNVASIVAEPFRIHGARDGRRVRERVSELLEVVGLSPEHAHRYPHEFSGGQLQRIGIARALALDPQVLILDEPVSALDVSIQAQILTLLQRLRDDLGLAYLFISHDLSVIRHICHRVAVMYMGSIVEIGDRDAVYRQPRHPYTQSLLSAVPAPDPSFRDRKRRIVLRGEIPTSLGPPSGCRFRSRCWKAEPVCTDGAPPLVAGPGGSHPCACHFPVGAEESAALPSGRPEPTRAK
jgi:peptide/nickel transport system ATP-binding protein